MIISRRFHCFSRNNRPNRRETNYDLKYWQTPWYFYAPPDCRGKKLGTPIGITKENNSPPTSQIRSKADSPRNTSITARRPGYLTDKS